MGIDAITEKIINGAIEYSDNLIAEAVSEAERINQDTIRETENIRKQSHAKGVNDTVEIINKTISAAELEARKMRLAVKQQEFASAVEAAIDKIADMDSEEYVDFLAAAIVKTGVIEGELLLNERDRNTIGKKLLKTVKNGLPDSGITLSSKTIETKGGFVIQCGNIEIDSTLETMVNAIKDKIAGKIVSALFQT